MMAARGGGAILNNASICAVQPLWYEPIYNVTKAALLMLSKNMATEFIPMGIRVNTINPGLILTPDWIKTAKQLSADTGGDWEGYLQSVADEHAPIKRFGTVEELADFFVFLCSPARVLRGRLHLLRRRRHAPHHLRRLPDGHPSRYSPRRRPRRPARDRRPPAPTPAPTSPPASCISASATSTAPTCRSTSTG